MRLDTIPGTETILVVDDDMAVLRLNNSKLKFHGYTATDTANGRKALQLFAVEPEITVDLLLVDMPMPGTNGAELVDHIWKRPGLPSFCYSGYSANGFLWPEIVRNVSYLAKPLIVFQLTQGIPKDAGEVHGRLVNVQREDARLIPARMPGSPK